MTGFLNIDSADSYVTFTIKELGVLMIKGTISGFDGEIYLDDTDIEDSFFDISLTPATVKTGNLKRDEHLRSKDFFYVKNHPTICFKSINVKRVDHVFNIKGTLSMLNVNKEYVIQMVYENGVFKGQFSLNRKHHGLGKKFPTMLIGKSVAIMINCVTKKK